MIDSLRIFIRVHPKTSEPDLNSVRTVLGISDSDPVVENAYNQGHRGDIVTFDFLNEPELTPGERIRWPNRAFGNAEKWLSQRTPEQFDKIRNAGLCADLCVSGYVGLFPPVFLEEMLRLSLDFWIFSLGSAKPEK